MRTINTTEIQDINQTRILLHNGEILNRQDVEIEYSTLDWEEEELKIEERQNWRA